MKVGLVIYSQTGNTRTVAEKLKERLTQNGHVAVLDEITISGKQPAQPGKFELSHVPAVDSYDALIFGAPVQAFSLNPVMKLYLEKLQDMKGRKVAVFVTKQLPLLRIGGTGAIAAMKKECQAKGAQVIGSEIVVWSKSKRERSIRECVDNLSALFQ